MLQLLKKEPLPTAAVFLVLLLSLSPIFGHHFGYSNDYSTFTYDNRNCCLGFPETKFVIAIGRPLQAVLLNFQLSFITGIQSLEWMRLLIVTTIARGGFVIFSLSADIHQHPDIQRRAAISARFHHALA